MKTNNDFMKCALKEAKKAYDLGEVPIGCVIVKDDKIIARAHNLRETKNSPTAHAEILCIEKASKKLDSWRLIDTTMYITLEPCIMCSGAIISARVPKVIYGAKDPRFGAHVSHLNLFDYKFNHNVDIEGGILEEECSNLIKDFFKDLRDKNKLQY